MNHERSAPRLAHGYGHTDLCFSQDGNYIVTCGSEGDVRIWNGFEDEDAKTICVGQVAFCVAQKSGKLYVGSDANQVQIFTFPDAELDGILTRFTAPVTTINVSIDGSLIAAGSEDTEIHLVECDTRNTKHFTGHKASILHVAIDPKLEFLASSSCDGSVRVWTIDDQKPVKEWPNVIKSSNSFKASESLCGVSWEPKTGRLFAVPIGHEIKLYQRCTWNIVTTLYSAELTKTCTITAWSSCGRYLAASTVGGEIFVWNTIGNRLASSSSDKHSVNITSLRWNPQSEKQQLGYCDASGQLVAVDKCFQDLSQAKIKSAIENSTYNETELGIDDFDDVNKLDDDDAEAISLERIKADYSGSARVDDDDDFSSVKSFESRRRTPPPSSHVELQPPFQPTATPAHIQRRFMVFNDIGYVRQTNTEEENAIDVDFHDASNHHAFRMKNLLDHSMAALNSDALVLACEKTDNNSSKLVCRLFKSWDSSKEWNVELPDDESAEAIAVGSKWLAVATNCRFLRIFSLSGVQREITTLLGPVVCLNAVNDLLLVVYHAAMGLTGDQNLNFMVYQVKFDLTILVAAQPLPISPKSTLKWAGFSDLDNLCILDSKGVLQLFGKDSGIWRPLCNVDAQEKGLVNHHFVIGVSEERQNIRCILCKGSYYPSTTPHPFITEIGWQLPMCEVSSDKGTLEEKLWRFSIAKECVKTGDGDSRKQFLATALKLFALADKTGHEMRIIELCEFANNKELTELALKYASRRHNEILVEKLTALLDSQEIMDSDRMYDYPDSVSPIKRQSGFAYVGESYDSYSTVGKQSRRVDNCQSQELFSETKNTLETNGHDSEVTVSLIAETKKKKTLGEQRREMAGLRKINPFKIASQWDSSTNSGSLEDNGGNLCSAKLVTKKSGEVEENVNVIDSSSSKKRKLTESNEPAVDKARKRNTSSKLQDFVFKK